MKITLKANLKDIQNFPRFRAYIRKEIVEDGLDEVLADSVQGLKSHFLEVINNAIRISGSMDAPDGSSQANVSIPQSEADLLEFLTAKNGKPGVDLTSFIKNGGKDYTTFLESNVVVVPDYRVSLRLPMGPFETFDEQLLKAKQFFNQSIFVFTDSKGNPAYYLNPGIDIGRFVKIVCSRNTGDTPASRKKFDNYQNSNKMTRQQNSEVGNFADWSIKRDGIDFIKSNFIDLGMIIQLLKDQRYDDAETLLKSENVSSNVQDVIDKVQDLKTGQGLTPNVQIYTDLLKAINGLKVDKRISDTKTIYVLTTQSDFELDTGDGTSKGKYSTLAKDNDSVIHNDFYSYLQEQLSLWKVTSADHWFQALVFKAEKAIQKFKG